VREREHVYNSGSVGGDQQEEEEKNRMIESG
jgi:hypothetical protein